MPKAVLFVAVFSALTTEYPPTKTFEPYKTHKVVSFHVPDMGADNKKMFAFQAPEDAEGGGITILGASVVNGAATGAGTSFGLALHKYSNAGTPAVNGTIAAEIGGTVDPWADGVPKDFTISSTYNFVDAGEWVVVQYEEYTAGNPTNCAMNIRYIMGK